MAKPMETPLTKAEHDEQIALGKVEPLLTREATVRLWRLRERALFYGSEGIVAQQFCGLRYDKEG